MRQEGASEEEEGKAILGGVGGRPCHLEPWKGLGVGGVTGHEQIAGRTEHLDSNLCAGRGPHPSPFGFLFLFFFIIIIFIINEVSFLLSKKSQRTFVLMNKILTTGQL